MTLQEQADFYSARNRAWNDTDWQNIGHADSKPYDLMEWAFREGYEKGYRRGRGRTTIELANEYHGNGYAHSWFAPINWYASRKRVGAFLDKLWQEYGPVEDEY